MIPTITHIRPPGCTSDSDECWHCTLALQLAPLQQLSQGHLRRQRSTMYPGQHAQRHHIEMWRWRYLSQSSHTHRLGMSFLATLLSATGLSPPRPTDRNIVHRRVTQMRLVPYGARSSLSSESSHTFRVPCGGLRAPNKPQAGSVRYGTYVNRT